jgi:HEPN domain-containing protein
MRIDPVVQRRLSELISKADSIKSARQTAHFREKAIHRVSIAEVAGWTASTESILLGVLGENSPHLQALRKARDGFTGYESEFDRLRSVLSAAQEDYAGGYLFSFRALVKAEVLDDALIQAEALLQSNFKDPACILIGVALEVTIKELARQAELSEAKLERLNADLCKAGKYNLSKQKQITAWADMRNKAAHGDWNEYTSEDVKEMFTGVQRFIADYLQ